MDKVKIGVVGVGRGTSMMNYCLHAGNAELVAVCDNWEEGLNRKKKELNRPEIAFYTSFDEFLNHDMDAVILANYANEHAPFAVKCLKAGKHVFSEVLPVQNLREAVELVEAVEKSDRIYAYGENYCYMPAPREMKKLYRQGVLGEFEYGEGEYLHNCESIWPSITYGDATHWRNNMYANFYCTHSIGPVVHITGLKPVSVVGFEMPFNARAARCGLKGGHTGVEMITFENGAVMKSIHGSACSRCSIWYSLYGANGSMESAREITGSSVDRIYVNCDSYQGKNGNSAECYEPENELAEFTPAYGHGGSDFFTMYNFINKILGKEADVIGVYEALDMFLPGLFAYRSVLNGGVPQRIPNLRFAADREMYRFDTACTDPKAAGDMLIPSYSKGNPVVPQAQYDNIRKEWLESLK